jgi:tetratricopeptide (TPR) repeat protein
MKTILFVLLALSTPCFAIISKSQSSKDTHKEVVRLTDEAFKISDSGSDGLTDEEAAAKIDRAIELAQKALKLEPLDWGAQYVYSSALVIKILEITPPPLAVAQLQKAIDETDRTLSLKPDDAGVLIQLAVMNSYKGNLDVAEKIYRKVILNKPDTHYAHSNLAEIMARKNNFDEAVALCNEEVSNSKDKCRGNILRLAGRFKESIAIFQKLAKESPNIRNLWGLANSLRTSGQCTEAVQAYNKVLELTRSNTIRTWINFEIALCQYQLGQSGPELKQKLISGLEFSNDPRYIDYSKEFDEARKILASLNARQK